ncbi:hypothetical protein HPB48_010987 [Haemaphysalis longicornis]|uniref:ABC transporter domain-containing protein n=1 Tax=Haemaphysalis longicornis TaxID=44386 RepID=A0A9J6FXR9_HAELO|nr:hypothetical protein HPB48_010987 [Haemaphysalis longicornis]
MAVLKKSLIKAKSVITFLWLLCADGLVDQQTHLRECELLPTTFFDFSEHGLLRNIVLVAVEAVVLFACVAYVHSGRSYWPKRRKAAAEDAGLDTDVAEEKRNVDHLCQTGDFSGHTMVAQNVHKFYGDFHAVRGINVGLRPAECFGLLGVNGAGKTTTFQMLAGFSELSEGEAYAENLKVTANPREWQSRIGYCFQIDGLLETLNAYEFLYLVGRLRGIADEDLRTLVDSLITLTDLNEYAQRGCGGYSGGNKRKLSVAAALLGLPPIVFLDEPYAGVDVVARNKIFKGLDRIKKLSKSTIVLTSHRGQARSTKHLIPPPSQRTRPDVYTNE